MDFGNIAQIDCSKAHGPSAAGVGATQTLDDIACMAAASKNGRAQFLMNYNTMEYH